MLFPSCTACLLMFQAPRQQLVSLLQRIEGLCKGIVLGHPVQILALPLPPSCMFVLHRALRKLTCAGQLSPVNLSQPIQPLVLLDSARCVKVFESRGRTLAATLLRRRRRFETRFPSFS